MIRRIFVGMFAVNFFVNPIWHLFGFDNIATYGSEPRYITYILPAEANRRHPPKVARHRQAMFHMVIPTTESS